MSKERNNLSFEEKEIVIDMLMPYLDLETVNECEGVATSTAIDALENVKSLIYIIVNSPYIPKIDVFPRDTDTDWDGVGDYYFLLSIIAMVSQISQEFYEGKERPDGKKAGPYSILDENEELVGGVQKAAQDFMMSNIFTSYNEKIENLNKFFKNPDHQIFAKFFKDNSNAYPFKQSISQWFKLRDVFIGKKEQGKALGYAVGVFGVKDEAVQRFVRDILKYIRIELKEFNLLDKKFEGAIKQKLPKMRATLESFYDEKSGASVTKTLIKEHWDVSDLLERFGADFFDKVPSEIRDVCLNGRDGFNNAKTLHEAGVNRFVRLGCKIHPKYANITLDEMGKENSRLGSEKFKQQYFRDVKLSVLFKDKPKLLEKLIDFVENDGYITPTVSPRSSICDPLTSEKHEPVVGRSRSNAVYERPLNFKP